MEEFFENKLNIPVLDLPNIDKDLSYNDLLLNEKKCKMLFMKLA